MSAISDVVESIGALIEQINETATATQGSLSQTDEAITAAEALGSEDKVEILQQVKEKLEGMGESLGGLSTMAEEAQGLVGTAGGT